MSSTAPLPDRARVIIIGGGVIGTSVAYHLAELAHQAAPHDAGITAVRRAVYARRAAAETTRTARAIFRRVADEE